MKPTIALRRLRVAAKGAYLHRKYASLTMLPRRAFVTNLLLADNFRHIEGCVVECGVWRGGMSAGMAELLGPRRYYLFDSFEGLPPAKEIDGQAAVGWQADKSSPFYYDNCKAEMSYAEEAMRKAGRADATLIKGWFSETLPNFRPPEPIAVLRLDGDWYESTMDCFTNLYPYVAEGGVIIVDDYYTWDGCARAVHDFLSREKLTDRIARAGGGVCFIVKRKRQLQPT